MIKKYNEWVEFEDIDPKDEDNLTIKHNSNYAENLRFRNYYRCVKCGEQWNDEWDSTCDDECPECGTIMTPYRSEDL